MSGRRRWIGALLVLATLVLAAGCTAPGGGASATNDAACAAVLPLAQATVHGQGTPIIIRRINRDDADTLSREAGVRPPPPPPPRTPPPTPPTPDPSGGPPAPKACLIVFQGQYAPGAVAGATPPADAGTYALIVLRVRHPQVERVLVTPTLPPDTTPRPWWQRIF